MFDQQKVFKVEDYVHMSHFLNQFVFKTIWGGLICTYSLTRNILLVIFRFVYIYSIKYYLLYVLVWTRQNVFPHLHVFLFTTAVNTASSSELFTATRGLLMILYESDSRHGYTTPDHWLIRYGVTFLFLNKGIF